jgi:hypothetical protein
LEEGIKGACKMSKQTIINKADLKPNPSLQNRPYNPEGWNQLYTQLDQVTEVFRQYPEVAALIRTVVEEITNISIHNKTWNWIKVRSEYTIQTNNIKIEIIYDGSEYFPPDQQKIKTVMGAAERLNQYEREYDLRQGETGPEVIIRLKLRP